MSTRLPARLAVLLTLVLVAEFGVLWWTRAAPSRDPQAALALFEGDCYLFDDPIQFFDPLVLGDDDLAPAVRLALEQRERFSREQRSRLVLWLGMRRDRESLALLEQLARDVSDLTVLRSDALQALAVIDSERGRALRAELLADPASSNLVRRACESLDQQDAAGEIWIWERGWWDALLGSRAPEN